MTRLLILYLGLPLVPAGIMMALGWRQLAAALVPVLAVLAMPVAMAIWVAVDWPVVPSPARVAVVKPTPAPDILSEVRWRDLIGVKPRRPGPEICVREGLRDIEECLEP
jgi:hypothetical protein